MPEPFAAALLVLLSKGTLLCGEWEHLATQQFAALVHGDLRSLLAINAQQAQLAGQLFGIQAELQQAESLLAASRSQGHAPVEMDATVRARQREFVAAAERVFAANYRNSKALNVLSALGAACEPLVICDQGQFYNGRGSVGRQRFAVNTIDREG